MDLRQSEIMEHVEGLTKLFVPRDCLVRESKSRIPAFYNPNAALGRDIAVCAASMFGERMLSRSTFVDTLAGVGARALRLLVEGENIDIAVINDVNPAALELAREGARANRVQGRCIFTNLEATSLLVSRPSFASRFAMVDIDPFGSPAPFFESALRSVQDEGLVAFTATDTAALCGVYPEVAFRRYQGYSIKVEEAKEIGIRLLLGGAAFAAMRLEGGITPLLFHVTRHYMRIYCQMKVGATHASGTCENIGYYVHCQHCLSRYTTPGPDAICRDCGHQSLRAGPLWIGEIASGPFAKEVSEYALARGFAKAYRVTQAVSLESLMPPGFYTLDSICSRLKVSNPPLEKVVERLNENGLRATRTHMNPIGIKTDASPSTLEAAITDLV